MIVLSQVLAAVNSIRLPESGETLHQYVDSVCDLNKSAMGTLGKVLGIELPGKEAVEAIKLQVPFFGAAIEDLVKGFKEINSSEQYPLIKWRGFAQSMKIVLTCITDPDWMESHKDLF